MFMNTLQPQAWWFCGRGILFKGGLARRSQCRSSRQIDDADSDALVVVDQCAVNYLDEALRSINAMRAMCLSLLLTSPFVDHSQIYELFDSIGPLLSNSHHTAAVMFHTSCYCTIRKPSFTKADNSTTSKLFQFFKYYPLRWRGIVIRLT